ncbi:hypothetical protein BD410DRAFT_820844 [Rickenella mellea]|uniref:Mitochondrial ribosomal protein subunit L20-domain-containing protein n=1 Tax=Rickenella mellea TaxID=50990 RepID=A0A4Y7Q658_9AGAM|nr:hypothetical protein BD410DRAFT_820844 [Rickenella mellea]
MSRARLLLRPTFSRTYATRRPVKPPSKIKDPLLSDPNAKIQHIPESSVTFIHRPPPSVPSPHSTTLAPASPLLLPASPLPDDPARDLPPELRRPKKHPNERVLDEEDFAQMRALRAQDPQKYSRNALAKMFGCSRFLVAQRAELESKSKEDKIMETEAEHEKHRQSWGPKKAMVMDIRRKRRSLW